jgi:hypothetical protein
MLISPRPSFKSGMERSLSLTEAVVQTPNPNPECCDQQLLSKISLSLLLLQQHGKDGVCVKVVLCIFLVLRAMGGVSLTNASKSNPSTATLHARHNHERHGYCPFILLENV